AFFGTSAETVIEKFREEKACSAAFKTFIPRRTRSEPEQQRGPGPSRSKDRRWAQKASVGAVPLLHLREGGREGLREAFQSKDPLGVVCLPSYTPPDR
ncbi:hypothetical protein M9458_035385, partial [Cirrhinus mrigala]